MRRTLIAALLSAAVFPGAGQIYNREFKKGWLIIIFLFIVIALFSFALSVQLVPLLSGGSAPSLAQIKHIVKELSTVHPQPFLYYNLLFVVVWIYSIVDAALGARRTDVAGASVAEPKMPDGTV